MTRKEAREFAMQTIFQIDAQKDFDKPDVFKYIGDKKLGNQKDYVVDTIEKIFSNLSEIDEIINANSEGWPIGRMGKTDLAIVRLAVCEMKYRDDVPKAVSVNEAVELAKIYGSDDSPRFINAVLAKIDK